MRIYTTISVTLALALSAISVETFAQSESFDAGKATFKVSFKEEVSQFEIMGLFVLPGEEVHLKVSDYQAGVTFKFHSDQAPPVNVDTVGWRWKAPASAGLYSLWVEQQNPADTMRFNVFVMVPLDSVKGEYLNGYHIGRYPEIPLKKLAIYKKPRGFIEVTEENQNTLVSPHFTIAQFLCKQDGGYPKYLVLRTRLLRKLERILEEVNRKGYACQTFHIMSGYRTPYYNKAIGNVKYSRHVWGGAADIFIDENSVDGMMDDINGDGSHTYKDAEILYNIIDDLYGKAWYKPFQGGLGWYRKTNSHGPFVHVDVRGFRARWGD
ncbi:MAG: D-Ala-D-Ala carboxypeptidase family metallohydrolase [bacterium]